MYHNENLKKGDDLYEIRHNGNGEAIHIYTKDDECIIFPTLDDLVRHEYLGEPNVERFYLSSDDVMNMFDSSDYCYYKLKSKYSVTPRVL